MLIIPQPPIRDPNRKEVGTIEIMGTVLDIIEPRSMTGTPILSKHSDSDVGPLMLLEIARGGERDLGSHPMQSVGIGGE